MKLLTNIINDAKVRQISIFQKILQIADKFLIIEKRNRGDIDG